MPLLFLSSRSKNLNKKNIVNSNTIVYAYTSQGFYLCYCTFFCFQSHHRSYLVSWVSRRESFRHCVIHHFFPMWQDWRLKSQLFPSSKNSYPLLFFFACQYIMGQSRVSTYQYICLFHYILPSSRPITLSPALYSSPRWGIFMIFQ